MAKKLTIGHRENVKYGGDLARELSELGRAVAESFRKVQEWVNSHAPETPRSPFVLDVFAGSGEFSADNCLVHIIEATEPMEFLLPPHKKDLLVVVKDGRNGASTNTITLKRNGGLGAIDGVSADFVLNLDGGAVWLMSDGPQPETRESNWWVIARA